MRHSSLALLAALLWASPAAASVCPKVSTTYTCTNTGNAVTNGTNFKDTVADASCGDTIVLPAGVEHQQSGGPVVRMPNKSCSVGQYVTIQSSALGSLPNGRVTYANLSSMPIIRTMTTEPAIDYANGAGWYKWIGILFTTRDMTQAPVGFIPTIVYSNFDDSVTLHHIVYDRIVVRPFEEQLASPDPPTTNWRSAGFGMRIDGATISITNSTIDGFCCCQSNDTTCSGGAAQSEAIASVTAPGPFTITNNYLGAWGWNIFTGGGGGIPQNTATITSPTNTSATFSSTTGITAGTTIRLLFASPGFTDAASECSSSGKMQYGTAIVDTVNSGTGAVTWHWICNASHRACPSVSDVPDSPGQAAWNGVALTNVSVLRNTMNKRASWVGFTQCKSFWEIKDGSNITFSGNTLTGPIDTLASPNNYCPISIATALNQNGSTSLNSGTNPWAATNNNVFTSNLAYGLGSVFAEQPYNTYCPAAPGTGGTFSNNLLFANSGRFSFLASTQNGTTWTVAHNTVRGSSNSVFKSACNAGDCDTTSITFKDNIVNSGGFYFNPFAAYPSLGTNHNMIIDDTGTCNGTPPNCNGWTAGTGDQILANAAAVGFTNLSNGDAINGFGSGGDYHSYKLTNVSPGHNAASDGTDIGVNFATLDAALGGTGILRVKVSTGKLFSVTGGGALQVGP